jgi:hypothetical protein
MIIFTYVDDCGVCAPSVAAIDAVIDRLRAQGFELSKESDFSEYLGIQFTRDSASHTITMTQPGLIKKIVATCGLTSCNPNRTPQATTALGSDPHGEPMDETWSYSSVVGMMLYLSTNTRPDIAFAVSQVARFSSNPKRSHATAIKTIVRYLAGSTDQGTIITPTNDLRLRCFVDADFAGLHGQEPDSHPSSTKSRTGYIVSFGGCPLVWKSQLQTETALSTFHAEYVALSAAARTVLHLQRLLTELLDVLKQHGDSPIFRAHFHEDESGPHPLMSHPSSSPIVQAYFFEDNASAHLLANTQRLSTRSRHLNVKWHWFWEQVRNESMVVEKIGTDFQQADYMTKGLSIESFESNRRANQGW